MTIERFRDVLASVGPDADAVELSELLWLARHLPAPETASEAAAEISAEVPSEPVETPEAEPPRPRPALPDPPAPPAELHAPPPSPAAGVTAREIWVPTAPMLTDPLGVQRALRPLKRRVPSRLRRELDEEATAARIADTRLWTPVLVPSAERWLSLTLVMDTGPAMRLWRPLARELVEALLRQGAFRDVRAAHLHPDGRVSATPGGPRRDAGTLLDPSGRQIVLVLSDCSGPHWWNGGARAAVRRWALTGPTAILQPLPERMWRRTAVPAAPGLATVVRPGGPNTELTFTPYGGGPPPVLPVPVLEIAPRWFAGWANLLAGGGPGPAAMADFGAASPVAAPVRREQRLPVEERVRRFLSAASPEAAELAAHVAVSVPSLPVMRLIQHRVLGASGPSQLAEVLLSGLLRPEGDRYEFVPGARKALLDTLPRPEAQHTRYVLEAVSAEIERRAGTGTEWFPALLHAEDGDRLLPDGTGAFAALSPEARELLDPGTALVTAEPPGLAEADERRELESLYDSYRERATSKVMHFGHASDGRPLAVPMPDDIGSEHGVVLGGAESERTGLLRTLVLQLALAHAPGELDLVLAARTDSPLHDLADLPHTVASLGDRSSPEWVQTVVRALEARFAALGGTAMPADGPLPAYDDVHSPSSWDAPEPTAPILVVVLDDAEELREAFPELDALLTQRMRDGLPRGVHWYVAAGTTDHAFLPYMLPILRWSAAFTGISSGDRAAVLGQREAPLPPERPGTGHLRLGQGRVEDFEADLLDDQTVAELAQRTPEAEAAPPAASPASVFARFDPDGSAERFRADLAALRAEPEALIPVGVDDQGELVGPPLALHGGGLLGGLISGLPETGTSELMAAVVLALALHHSPDQVNFVLFGEPDSPLAALPHVTASLTDRDLAQILTSTLHYEFDRRSGLSEADIAALPILFLVLDRNDQLVQENERFVRLLNAIADRGASLGMHVLLSVGNIPVRRAMVLWHIILTGQGRGVLTHPFAPQTEFQSSIVDPATLERLVERLAAHDRRAPSLFAVVSEPFELLGQNRFPEEEETPPGWRLPPGEPRRPIIGLGEGGGLTVNPLDHQHTGPHGLIVGAPRERRDMLRSLVLSLALAYPPEQLGIVLAGAGDHPLGTEIPLPHVLMSYDELLGDPQRLREFIDRLKTRLDARADAPTGTDWADQRESQALLVVVDVSPTLPSGRSDLVDLLVQIAAQGRRLGVHLVVAVSEVDRQIEWYRLIPSLSWRMSLGALPPEQNRHLHGRSRLSSPMAMRFGHLSVRDSEPVAFQALRQPTDDDLDLLVGRMHSAHPGAPARPAPRFLELNEPAPERWHRPPGEGDRLVIGTDRRGDPVALRPFGPFRGTGGLIVGGGAERTAMATKIVHGLAALHSPAHVSFMVASTPGDDTAGLGALLPHTTSVVLRMDLPSERDRFLTQFARELVRREEADAAVLEELPELFVVLFWPSADDPDLRPILRHFTSRTRQFGVHLILTTDQARGSALFLGDRFWQIETGPDSSRLWSAATGAVAFSPLRAPSLPEIDRVRQRMEE